MYSNNLQNRQIRIAVGASGRMAAAELIAEGRRQRLGIGRRVSVGIGQNGIFSCPAPTGQTQCAPPIQVCPENQKRYPLPFVPDAGYTSSVTAGSTVRFVGRPQKLFKPDRLIIASSIAPYFDIVSLTIGNIPQSLASGNVSSEMFSEVATYVMMTFDQAYPGIEIILTAQNKSSVTQTFQAQLVGEAVG